MAGAASAPRPPAGCRGQPVPPPVPHFPHSHTEGPSRLVSAGPGGFDFSLPKREPGPSTDTASHGRWRGGSTQVQTRPPFQGPAPSWPGEGKQPARRGLPAGDWPVPGPAGSQETDRGFISGGEGAPATGGGGGRSQASAPALPPPGSPDIRLKAGGHSTPILPGSSPGRTGRGPLCSEDAAWGEGALLAPQLPTVAAALEGQQAKGQGRGPAVTGRGGATAPAPAS